MEAQVFGIVDKPAVVVVSSWDPLVPPTRGFLREVKAYARSHHLSAVAVVLDPAPQRYLRGAANWPVYMSFDARLHYLLAEGLDGIVRIDFQESDLKLGVYDLLDTVRSRIDIGEIWMRPQQTFGPYSRGSTMAIALYAKKHNMVWRRPETPDTKVLANSVHHHLFRGEVNAAQALVGLPPIWSRPASDELEVAWPCGRYLVTPGLLGDSSGYSERIELDLYRGGDGLGYVRWPTRDIEHVTVLAGPRDTALQSETPLDLSVHGATAQ